MTKQSTTADSGADTNPVANTNMSVSEFANRRLGEMNQGPGQEAPELEENPQEVEEVTEEVTEEPEEVQEETYVDRTASDPDNFFLRPARFCPFRRLG